MPDMKTRCLQMPFNPRDSVARSLAWSFLEQGGSKVVTLFVQIVLARILAPEEFGIMAILLVLVNVADAVSQSGLGTALIQKSKTTDVECSTAFWLSMAVASLLFCLLFTVAPVVSAFYGERSFTPLLRVLSVVIVFNSMNSILRSRLQSAMDFKGLFKANVLAIVVSSAFGVGLALSGFGIWALVIQVVSQSACATLMLYLAASWRPSLLFDREAAKELFGYGWKICATGILNVLYMGASDLIIGKACSTGDLGYYSQGRKWPGAVVSIASNALQNVFFPVFSSLKDDRPALVRMMRACLLSGSLVVVPAAFFCAASAEPIVALLLTEKWLPSVPIFQMACLSNSVLLLQLVNLRAYMALGRSGLYLKLQVVKVVLGGVVICAAAAVSKDIYVVSFFTAATAVLSVLLVDMQPAMRFVGHSRSCQLKDSLPIYLLSTAAAGAAFCVSFAGLSYGAQLLFEATVFSLIYIGGIKLLNIEGAKDFKNLAKRLLHEKDEKL